APEAPTTIGRRFNYEPRTDGRVTGSVVLDPGSIQSPAPRRPGTAAASASESGAGPPDAAYPAAGPVPSREASNFLVVDPKRSDTRNTLAVMGPQLGYFYPEIVQQVHLSGPGIEAQGIAVPAAAMYILIGRTRDYAWSLTSANHDVRDVFAERLCNPDGTPPTSASTHYVFEGACRPFELFDAGTLNGTPIRYPRSGHGPVIGTATGGGAPYALTRRRPPRGPAPRGAGGLDQRLPPRGTGDYEWRRFLRVGEHPHDVRGPGDLLLNWNNRSAPGFMHGDDAPFGSAHRVELFDKWPRHPTLADAVSVMNRAATEDVRSVVWPVVSRVLRGGTAPS